MTVTLVRNVLVETYTLRSVDPIKHNTILYSQSYIHVHPLLITLFCLFLVLVDSIWTTSSSQCIRSTKLWTSTTTSKTTIHCTVAIKLKLKVPDGRFEPLQVEMSPSTSVQQLDYRSLLYSGYKIKVPVHVQLTKQAVSLIPNNLTLEGAMTKIFVPFSMSCYTMCISNLRQFH